MPSEVEVASYDFTNNTFTYRSNII